MSVKYKTYSDISTILINNNRNNILTINNRLIVILIIYMGTIVSVFTITFTSISVVCELLILYGFLRIKKLKKHPETLVFWSSFAQLILELHWYTGIASIRASLSPSQCQLLGSIGVYANTLSWNYIMLLSIEILLKILYPHHTNYKKRSIWYHTMAHMTSFVVFLILMLSKNSGGSLAGTCYVQTKPEYELLSSFPVFFQFPISLTVMTYTIWISANTFYAQYLNYHMLFVIVFRFVIFLDP